MRALLLEAHTDTLGGMVAEIKSDGRLRLTASGRDAVPENGEAENVRVYTRDGRVYRGHPPARAMPPFTSTATMPTPSAASTPPRWCWTRT